MKARTRTEPPLSCIFRELKWLRDGHTAVSGARRKWRRQTCYHHAPLYSLPCKFTWI